MQCKLGGVPRRVRITVGLQAIDFNSFHDRNPVDEKAINQRLDDLQSMLGALGTQTQVIGLAVISMLATSPNREATAQKFKAHLENVPEAKEFSAGMLAILETTERNDPVTESLRAIDAVLNALRTSIISLAAVARHREGMLRTYDHNAEALRAISLAEARPDSYLDQLEKWIAEMRHSLQMAEVPPAGHASAPPFQPPR
jgi:hypothetical protein